MADEMKIKVGVDVEDVFTGMKKAGKSVTDFVNQSNRFKAALANATDPKTVDRLTRALDATNAKIKSLKSAGAGAGSGLVDVAKGSNQATFALTNLGRVAQDAPFGFIGIQNNINPLLESFQRLRAESGSNKAAFKQLTSSLMGAGGLGLAVSVVTGLLTILAQKGFFTAKKQTDEAAQSLKDYKQSLKDTEAGVLATGLKLKGFVEIARNSKLSIEQRNEALKEANKIMGEHGEKLTLLNINTKAVTDSINKFTQATIQQVLASKFADRAADLVMKQRDASKEYGKELTKLNEIKKKTQSYENAQGVTVLTDAGKAAAKQTRLVSQLASAYKTVTGELRDVVGELQAAQVASSNLFGELGTKEKEAKTKKDVKVKEITTIFDVLSDLSKEIDFLNAKSIAFNTNEADAKIRAVLSTAEKLIKDFNVSPDDAIINKLLYGGQIQSIGGFKIPGGLGLKFRNETKTVLQTALKAPVEITVPVIPKIEVPPIDSAAFIKALRADKLNEGVLQVMQSLQDTTFRALGDVVSNAFEGGNVANIFANFFKTILSALGSGIQQLGEQTLIVQVIINKLKTLFGTSAGIGASIALIALGGVIRGLANRIEIPGFADGTNYFKGGLAVVGERGPELVNLPNGSGVIPNHSLSGAIGGGQSLEVTGSVVAKGSDLFIVFERAKRSLNRVG